MRITKQDFLDLGSNKLFIGDPCYVLKHEDYESGVLEVLNNSSQFEGVEGTTSKGIPITEWCDTKYGDGDYSGSSGVRYAVDAGILGVSVITDTEKYDEKTLNELGKIVIIPRNVDYVGIDVWRDSEEDGDVHIDVFIHEVDGKLNRINEVIYTAEDEESEDDYYEDNEEDDFEESRKVNKKVIKEIKEKNYIASIEDTDPFVVSYYIKGSPYSLDLAMNPDDISVESEYSEGDYYPAGDGSGLPGGWYDRGWSVENVDIDPEYFDIRFYDEDGNELTIGQFKNTFDSEESFNQYMENAKNIASSEIEDYIYNHPENYIGE